MLDETTSPGFAPEADWDESKASQATVAAGEAARGRVRYASPEALFRAERASLVREAYLAVQKHGLPFDKLTIYGIDADGVEVSQGAISLQSGLSLAPGRELVEEVDWTLDGSKVADAVWGSYSLGGESQFDGRVLSARLRLPEVDTRETYVGYLTGLIPALEKLNREGYRIAVLQLSIDDAMGDPVLRDVHDFQLGLVMTWHDGEEYRPPWMDEEPPRESP